MRRWESTRRRARVGHRMADGLDLHGEPGARMRCGRSRRVPEEKLRLCGRLYYSHPQWWWRWLRQGGALPTTRRSAQEEEKNTWRRTPGNLRRLRASHLSCLVKDTSSSSVGPSAAPPGGEQTRPRSLPPPPPPGWSGFRIGPVRKL